MKITYVAHDNIDREKWDRCIEHASNKMIYAQSYYLDIMSKNWGALVMNDYEAVMPLTWNKKFGISYLYQPAFTQQLGIFGNHTFNNEITEPFIDKALEQFPFIEINLNYANQYKKAHTHKRNFILPLNQTFSELEKNFRKDFVNQVHNSKLAYSSSENIEETIQLFRQHYSDRISVSEKAYENLQQLYLLLKSKEQLFIRQVSSPAGELLTTAIFLKDNKRIYYVMSVTLANGRKAKANYFLLYHVIKEFAEQELVLDFEGSEIASIRSFFLKFGAIEETYPFVKINNLPPAQKWIKNSVDRYKSRS